MYTRKIYLNEEKIKEINIFDGFTDFKELTQTVSSYGHTMDTFYVIRFYNMLYGFFYDDWHELILGQDILYYTNLDSHICKRSRKNGMFDWPYEKDEITMRTIPNESVFGVANDLMRMDKFLAIYYCENNKWYQIDNTRQENELKCIINEFGKQFYRDFFFSRIEVDMYLKPYFESSFLKHLDAFYKNGAFEVNPFTWKATVDNTGNTLYCSFFDRITKQPLCEIGGKYYEIN